MEDYSELDEFVAGHRNWCQWLSLLALPNIERFIRNHCTTRASTPEELDALEYELVRIMPQIDQIEADHLRRYPSATPLMRHGDRCPTLFFQAATLHSRHFAPADMSSFAV